MYHVIILIWFDFFDCSPVQHRPFELSWENGLLQGPRAWHSVECFLGQLSKTYVKQKIIFHFKEIILLGRSTLYLCFSKYFCFSGTFWVIAMRVLATRRSAHFCFTFTLGEQMNDKYTCCPTKMLLAPLSRAIFYFYIFTECSSRSRNISWQFRANILTRTRMAKN